MASITMPMVLSSTLWWRTSTFEISQVAIGALETLLHNNGDALVGDVEEAIQADKRFRKALGAFI